MYEALEQMQHRLDLIDRTLVVNNPDSPRAAEVFDGLRKQVARSVKVTQLLEASVAQLDDLVHSTSDPQLIQAKTAELLAQAGVVKVQDAATIDPSAFQVVGEGDIRLVVRPAYVTAAEGAIVMQGVIELASGDDGAGAAPPSTDGELEADSEEGASE